MSFRFRPPPGPLSAETAWALRQAFGPTGAAEPEPPDLDAALERVIRLGLAERVWSRQRHDPSAAGLAGEAREPLERAFRRSVAAGMAYEELAGELAGRAAELEVPIVFLKGHALALSGAQPAGSRRYSDIDLLSADDGARILAADLAKRGWESPPITGNEQHLPALRSPRGGVVEIHFRLRGVRVGETAWADIGTLTAAEALEAVPSLPGACSIPRLDVQIAHLLVHGLDQHGHRPRTYPLLRMIGDLADLLPEDETRRELPGVHRMIEDAVSREEMDATLELVDRLTAGALPEPATRAEALLRHLVAGTLDDDYAASLAVGHLSSRLGAAARQGHLGAYLRRKLWPEAPGARSGGLSGLLGIVRRLGGAVARLGRSAALRRRGAGPPRSR